MTIYTRRKDKSVFHFGLCDCLKGKRKSDVVVVLAGNRRPKGDLCDRGLKREARAAREKAAKR